MAQKQKTELPVPATLLLLAIFISIFFLLLSCSAVFLIVREIPDIVDIILLR